VLAKDVMKSPVITVREGMKLAEVVEVLEENGISGAPVVDAGGRLVGIVSEFDLIRHSQTLRVKPAKGAFGWISPYTSIEELARYTQGLCTVADTPVEAVMTRKVITVAADDSLEKVAELMARHRINRVPVLDGEKLVGIISRGELVWAMANLCERKPGIFREL